MEEILDLGNGVALTVVDQKGRPAGSRFEVRMRYAAVAVEVEGLMERVTMYPDIEGGRAAAERGRGTCHPRSRGVPRRPRGDQRVAE